MTGTSWRGGPGLLRRIDAYCHLAPLATARAERHGRFTVFVNADSDGWPYAVRPCDGDDTGVFDVADVRAVCEAQRAHGAEVAIEWIDDLYPGLAAAAAQAGLRVDRIAMMVLRDQMAPVPAPPGVRLAWMDPGHPRLAGVNAAIGAAFVDSDLLEPVAPSAEMARALASGRYRQIGAWDVAGEVGGGAHSPRGDVTELTGIGVIPRARSRGVGAAVTAALAADAAAGGIGLVFLTATDQRVAAFYRRLGFETVATACTAEPAGPRA